MKIEAGIFLRRLSAMLTAPLADHSSACEAQRSARHGHCSKYRNAMEKSMGCSMLLLGTGVLFAVLAASIPADAQVQLQWLGSQKVEQMIGDVDWDVDSTTRPPLSGTYTNYFVLGNGLGYSFDHFDIAKKRRERIFLFGDTIAFGAHSDPLQPGQPFQPVGAAVSGSGSSLLCLSGPRSTLLVDCSQSEFNYHGRDPFAWSTTRDGEKQLRLHFFKQFESPLPLFVTPSDLQNAPLNNGPVATGGDDIPNSGISVKGEIYMVYSTGSNAGSGNDPQTGCPASHRDSYSVLVKFVEPDHFFQTQREISYVTPGDVNPAYDGEGGHFLFTSLHKVNVSQGGISEPMILMYGVGWYRCSNVYLAMVPERDFEKLNNVQFFMGYDGNNSPIWSNPTNWNIASDAAAQPLVIDETSTGTVNSLPSIGNISVSFVRDLGLWLMTYDGNADGRRAVYFRYATAPWGPWSTPPAIIYDPCRDGGSGTFIFYFAENKNKNECPGALPGVTSFPASAGPAGPMIAEEQGADPTTTPGIVFAPYMIERFTRVKGDILSIYYTMSTWNPYTVVKMRSDFLVNNTRPQNGPARR